MEVRRRDRRDVGGDVDVHVGSTPGLPREKFFHFLVRLIKNVEMYSYSLRRGKEGKTKFTSRGRRVRTVPTVSRRGLGVSGRKDWGF